MSVCAIRLRSSGCGSSTCRPLEGTLGPGLTVPAEDGYPTALRAAAYKMNDQRDDRYNQENVNQAPRDVEYKPTKDPCDEQGHEQDQEPREKHGVLL